MRKKTELFQALESKNLKKVVHTIESSPTLIETRTRLGQTPLHIAVIKQDYKSIYYLLTKGAKTSCLTQDNQTPYHLAALRGDIAAIRMLLLGNLRKEDEIEFEKIMKQVTKGKQQNILHLAVHSKKNDVLELLLKLGHLSEPKIFKEYIDAQDYEGNTPLATAALLGDNYLFETLEQANAAYIIKNNRRQNLLHLAALSKNVNLSLIEHILNQTSFSTELDIHENSALYYALYKYLELYIKTEPSTQYTQDELDTLTKQNKLINMLYEYGSRLTWLEIKKLKYHFVDHTQAHSIIDVYKKI